MWEEIMKLAVGNGMWAAIAVALLTYLIKDSRRREQKYTDIIDALAASMKVVDKIKEDTEKLLSFQGAQGTVLDAAVKAIEAATKQAAPKTKKGSEP